MLTIILQNIETINIKHKFNLNKSQHTVKSLHQSFHVSRISEASNFLITFFCLVEGGGCSPDGLCGVVDSAVSPEKLFVCVTNVFESENSNLESKFSVELALRKNNFYCLLTGGFPGTP